MGFPHVPVHNAFLTLPPYRDDRQFSLLAEMAHNSRWDNLTQLILNMAPNSTDAVSAQHHPRVLSLWMLPSLGNVLTLLNQAVCLLTLIRIQSTSPRHTAKGTQEIPQKKGKLHMVFFICWFCNDTIMHLLDC